MKKILLIVLCTTLVYCAKKENTTLETKTDSRFVNKTDSQIYIKDSAKVVQQAVLVKNDETPMGNNISINEITNLPADIDGCGSYFSSDKSKYNASKFIYVDNTENAYMHINEDLEMLDIVKDTEKETILSNEKYNVKIKSTKIEDLEEGTLLKGNIEITSKNNSEKQIVNFYGGVGC